MAKSELDKVVDKLKKTYKDSFSDPHSAGIIKRVQMSSPNMNYILGGGFAVGKPITLFGPECLDGDTLINVYVTNKDGKEVEYFTESTVSIRELFEHLNKKDRCYGDRECAGECTCDGNELFDSLIFYIFSKQGNMIDANRIEKVISCGKKQVFEVEDSCTNKISCTENHELCTPQGFRKLKELKIGDQVYIQDDFDELTVSTIKSIIRKDIVETYDLTCADPYNNYVANNFVVHNSGGKTVLAYYVASQFQKRTDAPEKRKVLFVDIEHSFNVNYAMAVGLDPDNNFELLRPLDGEEGFEIVDSMVRTGEIGLVVWDSVAATGAKKTMESEYGKATYGGTAALMSQGLIKLNPLLSRYETSMIFINQVRAKIGGMMGYYPGADENSNVGGWALKFYSQWRGRVSKGEDIVLDKEVIGNQIKIRNVKSKIGVPKRSITLDLYYDRGLDTDSEYIDFIVNLELVQKAGAWLSNDDWKMKVQGRDGLLKWLKENPDRWEEARQKVDASFSGATILDRIDIDVPGDTNDASATEVDDEETYSDGGEK
jgi:recombination protein RecA